MASKSTLMNSCHTPLQDTNNYLNVVLLECLMHVPLEGFDEVARINKLEHLGLEAPKYALQLEGN